MIQFLQEKFFSPNTDHAEISLLEIQTKTICILTTGPSGTVCPDSRQTQSLEQPLCTLKISHTYEHTKAEIWCSPFFFSLCR